MEPTLPASTTSRASRPPAPRKVSGAHPNLSPRRSASRTSLCPSSALTQSGFSENTCLPAVSAAWLTSKWALGVVRLTTMFTSGSRIKASMASARIPNRSAWVRALSSRRSAHATGRTPRNATRFCM